MVHPPEAQNKKVDLRNKIDRIKERNAALAEHDANVAEMRRLIARYKRNTKAAQVLIIAGLMPVFVNLFTVGFSAALLALYLMSLAVAAWCAYHAEMAFERLLHRADKDLLSLVLHVNCLSKEDIHNALDESRLTMEMLK